MNLVQAFVYSAEELYKQISTSGLTTEKIGLYNSGISKSTDEESNFSAERQSEPVMVRDRCE